MAIEVKINWTANQWRRFLGKADMTPIVEVMSIMADRVALVVVEQHLEALTAGTENIDTCDG